jgi:hypothetical protein
MAVELTILTVPDCPHTPVLDERLAQVLAGRPDVSVVRRVITDGRAAARSGMRGSPTLLIDGVDPFDDTADPPSMSCRIYRDSAGRMEPVPSVAALREALEIAAMPDPRPEPWSDPLGRFGAGRVAPVMGGLQAGHQLVLRSFATIGQAPSAAELAQAVKPYDADPEKVLADLHAADFLRLDEAGRIRAAYPFSADRTAHVVHIAGGPRVFAMCAIDALGIAAMLGTDVTIRSADPAADNPITVTVPAQGLNAVWDPVTVVVFAGRQADCVPCADPCADPIAESIAVAADQAPPMMPPAAAADVCCAYVNFFATAAGAATWAESHPQITGRILGQVDAVRLGSQIFGPLLTARADERRNGSPGRDGGNN